MLETTRWNPRSEMVPYADPMTRFFDRFLSGPLTEELSNRRWMPATDIRETDDTYEVTTELPGMTKDDIDITVENNVLTLRGERRSEAEREGNRYHRIERSYGAFTRSFTLPGRVSTDKVDATFQDGILTISVPKLEEARPRKIAIH